MYLNSVYNLDYADLTQTNELNVTHICQSYLNETGQINAKILKNCTWFN